MRRLLMLTAALALFATACAAAGATGDDPATTVPVSDGSSSTSTAAPDSTPAAQGVLPDGPSALSDMSNEAFPDPLVPVDEILSGGPPPDGIPPIDNPVFLPVADNLEILDPAEPVVFLEINGDARAYPIRAMVWHEIVNDTVGGVPVSVTYCPLCNSAVTYVREINGVETTFGTSGRLFASALVMYDRATESLWTHFDGRAVVGVLTGAQLESIASPLLSWGDFRESNPTGQVLDWNATGFNRDYGRNPYFGYDDPDTNPFLFRGTVDDRARAKQRVVGVAIDGEAAAFSLDLISGGEAKATSATVGDNPIVILWKAGQSSALDTQDQVTGKDVGSVGVFDPVVDGELLTFTAEGDRFVDDATSSTWTITGEAVDGPLAGTQLERLDHLDTFWFAWSTYQPETVLVEN
ncbi:MAG: DUF3179 domain-containing protein [Acidimicrobiia bacterium]|nr:MAG: DUF3179 domain-containing protein [Acidimicrobiia bacterium]